MDTPSKRIRLIDIHPDDDHPRGTVDKASVKEYLELMKDEIILPPIEVFQKGKEPMYHLSSGWTRYTAALEFGDEFIDAIIHIGDENDAFWHGCSCNKHGKPLTPKEKRHMMTVLFQDNDIVCMENSELAEHCGVTRAFINKMKGEMFGKMSVEGDWVEPTNVNVGNLPTVDNLPSLTSCNGAPGSADSDDIDDAFNDAAPSVDVDALKEWNKLMEKRAKVAMSVADGVDDMCNCLPKDAKHNIKRISKALAGTFRTAKGYRLCPACDGSGCPKCLYVGWCNKNRWEMITA